MGMQLQEVTQRRYERYQEKLISLSDAYKGRSAAAYNRIVIEAAAEAGIATGTPADLGDLSPRTVQELTARILAHIREAVEPVSGEA